MPPSSSPRRPSTRAASAAVTTLLVLLGALVVVATPESTTPAAANPARSAPTTGWRLVGREEFDRLDRSRWQVYDGRRTPGATGAARTARPWRVSVSGGALRLRSGRDGRRGWSGGAVGGWRWAEARRASGRIDMRVRTSVGRGASANLMLWPDAHAGMPALEPYHSPAAWSGRARAQQRTHYRAGGALRRETSTRSADFRAWRTVSVRWDARSVIYLVDGRVTRVDRAARLLPDRLLWPLLQTAVERDARGRLPRARRGPTTSIDWIRVYAARPTTPPPPAGPPPTIPPTPTTPPTAPPTNPPPTNPPPTTPPPTTPPPTTPPTTPPDAGGEWVSVGRDDFSGSALDRSRWTPFSGVPGCCKDTVWSPDQVEVSDGELVLHNRPTAYGWRSGGVGSWKWQASVRKYGRIDARIRFDKGQGFSAAALTWPADNTWPPEIDFYEIFETRGDRDMMAQSTHFKAPGAANGRGVDQKFNRDGDFSRWHTVSVRWASDELSYWVDGVRTHVIRDAAKIPHTAMWIGFQTHTHKMGGAWPTLPGGRDTVALRVDWVEVYAPVRR